MIKDIQDILCHSAAAIHVPKEKKNLFSERHKSEISLENVMGEKKLSDTIVALVLCKYNVS